jgi:hypothetical protein
VRYYPHILKAGITHNAQNHGGNDIAIYEENYLWQTPFES